MKKSTAILGGVLLLMLTFAALFTIGGMLTGKVHTAEANAGDYPRPWAAIRALYAADEMPQRFGTALPEDASACRLEDVTITLYNRGFFDAEWVSVSVEGAAGDIAVYSITGEGGTVAARSYADLNLKLIARADERGIRRYRIQYYVYGMRQEITVEA